MFINNSSLTITYSDIEGGWEGEGNIDADPLFCNADSSDFTLYDNSPCVGTGQGGANMVALDIGCYWNPTITVTSPNGSENWELESTQDITWSSRVVSGDVKIELYQNGSAYQIIESSTDNDGSYSWTIPETYDEGTDYKVRISSVSDATVYDESDGIFALTSGILTDIDGNVY